MAGIEPYARTAALELLFAPAATNFVSLLDILPIDGVGESEISPAGYTRIAATNWSTTSITGSVGVTSRCNDDVIIFGTYAAEVTTIGWAIYDAVTGGNLLSSGPFVDAGFGLAGLLTIPMGDDIQFQPGDLCMSLSQDCPIVAGSAGDVCSLITGITVSVNGSPPAPWNIGDPPTIVPLSAAVTIVISLAAPSTDMAGFAAAISNATPGPFIPGVSDFTVVYMASALPSLSQIVTVENLTLSPVCIYALSAVTQTP